MMFTIMPTSQIYSADIEELDWLNKIVCVADVNKLLDSTKFVAWSAFHANKQSADIGPVSQI